MLVFLNIAQKKQMSNRILIFSETVLYFQCRACVTGNSLHGAATAYNNTNRAIRLRSLRNFTEFYFVSY